MTEKENLTKEAKELQIKGIYNMSIDALKKSIAEAKSDGQSSQAAKTKKSVRYKNTCKGIFTMLGMIWKPGQALPVSKEIAVTKKFKHAVKLGVLVKK